jgi:hypothetical protein
MTAAEDVPTRRGQFGADTVVRHVMGVDRQHRVLAMAEQIEPACASRNTSAAVSASADALLYSTNGPP